MVKKGKKQKKAKFEYSISDPIHLNLLGCVFYGDPFHDSKEWSYKNEIGKLWQRFMRLSKKYSSYLEKINVEPGVAYELHLEPEEYENTKRYYVFVAIAVDFVAEVPLEFFQKALPKTKYLQFTTKATAQNNAEYFFKEWLGSKDAEESKGEGKSEASSYDQAYPYVLQRYDERYRGLNDPKSELGWMVPIKKMEEN